MTPAAATAARCGRRRALARLGLLALAPVLPAVLLSGCGILGAPADAVVISGRFSGRISRDGRTQSASGRYRLTQTRKADVLELLTPLYGVLGRVTVSSAGAVLERGSQPPVEAPSAEALMQEAFGFALPVPMLKSWLAGRPAASAASRTISPESFEQAGWRVTVRRRLADGSPAVLALSGGGISLSLTIEP